MQRSGKTELRQRKRSVQDELPRRYRRLRRLGQQHGRATVYRALDDHTGREVAIKFGSGTPDSAGTLGHEFRLLSRIGHPHVVRAYGLDWSASGIPYLVTDFAGVRSLLEAGRSASKDEMLRLARQSIMGLDAIHRLGCIHGDVKPSHLMVPTVEGGDRVVLVDLGLARPIGPTERISGTPGFLSPEMLRFEVVGPQTDWFSLGMALLHSLLREVPRSLQNTELAARNGSRWRSTIHRAVQALPRSLRDLLILLLEPSPSARSLSAADLLERTGADRSEVFEHERSRLLRLPMVGRRQPMRRLRAVLEASEPGRLSVIRVAGVSGSGKSRLLQEFGTEASLRGAHVLKIQARGPSLDLEALLSQSESGLVKGTSETVRIREAVGEASKRSSLERLVNRLTHVSATADRSVVILIDEPPLIDLELLDALHRARRLWDSRRELECAMGRRPRGASVLVVAVSHRGAPRETLHLGALGPVSSQRLLRAATASVAPLGLKYGPRRAALPAAVLLRVAAWLDRAGGDLRLQVPTPAVVARLLQGRWRHTSAPDRRLLLRVLTSGGSMSLGGLRKAMLPWRQQEPLERSITRLEGRGWLERNQFGGDDGEIRLAPLVVEFLRRVVESLSATEIRRLRWDAGTKGSPEGRPARSILPYAPRETGQGRVGNRLASWGQIPEAIAAYLQAIESAREAGNRGEAAVWARNAARLHRRAGQWARAAELLEQAWIDALHAGDPTGLAKCRAELMRILLDRGDILAARRLLPEGESLLPEDAGVIAQLLMLEGRVLEALAVLRRQLERGGDESQQVEVRLLLGEACDQLGRRKLARGYFGRALDVAMKQSDGELVGRCLRRIVSDAARNPRGAGAKVQIERRARRLAVEAMRLGDVLERARAQFALSEWNERMGRALQARNHARKALASFIRLGARLDRQACRRLLVSQAVPRRFGGRGETGGVSRSIRPKGGVIQEPRTFSKVRRLRG